jgi:hypothetical protein
MAEMAYPWCVVGEVKTIVKLIMGELGEVIAGHDG